MQHLGDYELGSTINFRFVTTEPDTGAPATLSGTPAISAYVGNSATQITAGITLGVDHDSVTGLNLVTVVLTSGNGYADNTDIDFVITTGTVDGNSAVGYVVGRCSLGRNSAYRRLGAPAGASVSADISAIEAQTDDIGTAGAGLTAIPWNSAWDAEVESEVDDALGGGTGTALTSIPWNAAWDAEVQSECADALTAYDPPTRTEATADKAEIQSMIGQRTTIATLASQTSFTLTAGSADDDAYNGWAALVIDASTAGQTALGTVSDYTGSTKTITLVADPAIYTMAVGDTIVLIPGFLTTLVNADVKKINAVTVIGAGTSGDKWRG